jgi:hypothetical protein
MVDTDDRGSRFLQAPLRRCAGQGRGLFYRLDPGDDIARALGRLALRVLK